MIENNAWTYFVKKKGLDAIPDFPCEENRNKRKSMKYLMANPKNLKEFSTRVSPEFGNKHENPPDKDIALFIAL